MFRATRSNLKWNPLLAFSSFCFKKNNNKKILFHMWNHANELQTEIRKDVKDEPNIWLKQKQMKSWLRWNFFSFESNTNKQFIEWRKMNLSISLFVSVIALSWWIEYVSNAIASSFINMKTSSSIERKSKNKFFLIRFALTSKVSSSHDSILSVESWAKKAYSAGTQIEWSENNELFNRRNERNENIRGLIRS